MDQSSGTHMRNDRAYIHIAYFVTTSSDKDGFAGELWRVVKYEDDTTTVAGRLTVQFDLGLVIEGTAKLAVSQEIRAFCTSSPEMMSSW
jgi:hypothetical protein